MGLLFLNEWWGTHLRIGSNGPYWSLGFEVWYYVAFGFLVFGGRVVGRLGAVATMVFVGPRAALYFPVWLAGAATYWLVWRGSLGPRAGAVLAAAAAAGAVVLIRFGHSINAIYDPVGFGTRDLWSYGYYAALAALMCGHVAGMAAACAAVRIGPRIGGLARGLGQQTFTLYLLHMPLQFLAVAVSPWPVTSWTTRAMVFLGVPLVIAPVAVAIEQGKPVWRRWAGMFFFEKRTKKLLT
jgi:fucose 4-O-acetylase-like acetyltransferase